MENGNVGNRGSERLQGASNFEQLEAVEQMRQGVEQAPASPERVALERLGQIGTENVESTMPATSPVGETIIADTGTVDDENPDTAEDGEKIEQEWAARIQKIVELTKDNPRVEQIEVNKLKADYMKKRFNRELGDRN